VGVRKFLRSFTQGIQTLRSSQRIATAMALSFLVWLTHIVVIYCLIRSFGYDLPLGAAATVMIVNTLALMVPITPGNAGTFEVAVSTSLAAFSIPRSDAVLIALSLHLVDLLPLIAFGAGILRSEKESIKEISTRQGDTTILDEVDEDGCLIEREAV